MKQGRFDVIFSYNPLSLKDLRILIRCCRGFDIAGLLPVIAVATLSLAMSRMHMYSNGLNDGNYTFAAANYLFGTLGCGAGGCYVVTWPLDI